MKKRVYLIDIDGTVCDDIKNEDSHLYPTSKVYEGSLEQINKLNVKCKYLDAVKPTDLSKKNYDLLSTTNKTGSLIYNKFTRLPVMLSFIMCFIDALENNYKTIIIMIKWS